MYRILIADDERIIRKGIVAKLQRLGLDIDLPVEACDGRDALEALTREKPDIAFVDIRMPLMDGIELIRKCRELSIQAKFIVVSGYAEFEYARDALRYGATAYLLKPIGDAEFEEALRSAIGSVDEDRLLGASAPPSDMVEHIAFIERERFLNQLIRSGNSEADVHERFLALSFAGARQASCFQIALFCLGPFRASASDRRDLVEEKGRALAALEKVSRDCSLFACEDYGAADRILVLFMLGGMSGPLSPAEKYVEKARAELSNRLRHDVLVALGPASPRFGPELYRHAREALSYRLLDASCRVFRYRPPDPDERYFPLGEELRLLERCLECGDMAGIQKSVTALFSLKNLSVLSPSRLRLALNEIAKLSAYAKRGAAPRDSEELLSDTFLDSVSSIEELASRVSSILVASCREGPHDALSRESRIHLAARYIEEHYYLDLPVNELAAKYSMTPNYFSTAFRAETGATVVSYIRQARLRHACHLLADTDAPIADISASIGYSDPQYFFRVFKKALGMTPMEFRNNEKNP